MDSRRARCYQCAMLRASYDWTMQMANRPGAMWAIAVIAFVESSFFPIPPDVMLIPMVLAAPTRAWRIAAVCTIASVLGGVAGYGIGYFLYESVAAPIIGFYGYQDKFSQFAGYYNAYGPWIVFGAGLTPFPYKVITIASGITQLEPMTFLLASLLSRGLRFFIVAALLWKFGTPIRRFIDKYLGLLTLLLFVLLFGGFLIFRLLF